MNSDNRYFLCNSVHSAGNSACCGFVWSLSQDSAVALNSKLQEEIEKLQEEMGMKIQHVVDHKTANGTGLQI